VSYLRVSTKDQASRGGLAEGLSIPAQRDAIRIKADAHGAQIVAEFVDAGESGRSADRPQLQEMLPGTSKSTTSIWSSCTRSTVWPQPSRRPSRSIWRSGSRRPLVSVTENVDETPQGQLVHGIFSAVADFYSQNLAQEVVKGMEQKVRNGGTLSRAPIGYQNVRTIVNGAEARRVEIDEDRAEHVRWAFETYADDPDMTLHRMVELLVGRGLTIRATAKQAERNLQRSHVHRC
jgi:site-specific DNA recombinase